MKLPEAKKSKSVLLFCLGICDAVRPSSILISGADKPMSAGKSYLVECTASGSRPAATIRWYLRSSQQAAKEKVSNRLFKKISRRSIFFILIRDMNSYKKREDPFCIAKWFIWSLLFFVSHFHIVTVLL